MIKLGKLTDYAIVIMGQLMREGEGASKSAHFLSAKTGVPEPTVAKVLKMLAHAALVDSSRGAAGGYRLSRGAADISIADIITAMDGPIAIVSCVEGSAETCKAEGSCHLKGRWDHVNSVIRAALEGVRLPDMIDPDPTIVVKMRAS